MDFNAIYKLNEDEQQNANPAPAQGEEDGLPQDVHASEEALNIAMNQLQLIVKSFKEDNYIQQMMDFYDGKSAKKESVEADNNAEHLTEAKKGSFKSYYNQIVKSLSNTQKKIKIAAMILIATAIVAGVGVGTVLIKKLVNNKNALKVNNAEKTAEKTSGSDVLVDDVNKSLSDSTNTNVNSGVNNTETSAENSAEDSAKTATEELVEKPVDADEPKAKLGGLTTKSWVNDKKTNGLTKDQVVDAYEKEGFSRSGPLFITAMVASYGSGQVLKTVSLKPGSSEFVGETIDGKAVKGDINTYQAMEISQEEKQAKDTEIKQVINSDPENAEKLSQEVKKEEADNTTDTTANENGEANAENSEPATEQEKEAINEANAQNAWQKGQQAGAQIRNIKGGMGSGYAMWLEDSQKLVWSDKKSGGTQFEFLNTTDGGQSFICGSKHYVFDGKQYQVDKNAAVLNEQGQPLTLVQFVVRESQKNAKYDAQVDQYVNTHGKGSNYCGQYTWGGIVNVPKNNPRNPGETEQTWVLSSKLYLNGQKTNFVIMPVSTGQIVAADPDKQQIIFLQSKAQPGSETKDGMPIGTPLTMPQVVQKLIEKSQLNGAAVAVGLTAPAGYGALIGTAICPGLGTFIGGMIGLFGGALATGIAADFKKKGIFGVIAWNTLDEQSKQLLVAHAAKNFAFSQKDAEGLDEQELTTKVNAGKQIFQQNGINIINAGHPQPTDSINCVLRNAGNAIASALLGCKNNGNPYQVAAEQYIQPQA